MAVATGTALLAGALASGGAALLDNKNQRKALKSAEQQKAASQAFIEKQLAQARSDIFKLFPAAQNARTQGLEAGLHLYKQAYPAMMNTFQRGNVGAQNALIQGLQPTQNAILGRPVNYAPQAVQLQQPQGLTLPTYQPQQLPQGLQHG